MTALVTRVLVCFIFAAVSALITTAFWHHEPFGAVFGIGFFAGVAANLWLDHLGD